MAESGVEQFVTPLRQAQAVLGHVGEVARTLADDSLFGSLMSQLSALPGAASFNPLQATRQMAVEIAPARQEAPQENATRRQFVDALQQNARKSASAGKPEQSANPDARSARLTDESPARHSQAQPRNDDVASVITPENGGAEKPAGGEQHLGVGSVVRDTVRATLGSWAALERIAELVQQLEPSGSAAKSPVYQEAPEPQGSPLPLASARAPQLAPGSGPQQEQRVQESPTGAKDAGNKGESVTGNMPTLQELVDGTWGVVSPRNSAAGNGSGKGQDQPALQPRSNSATGSAAEQMVSGGSPVAPRGPSMLNPQVAGGNKPDAGAAPSPAGAASAGGGDRGGLLPLSAGVIPDDELAERLNRALIEQAWRGGVDLT